MKIVTIQPKNKRARERVKMHGEEMELLLHGSFRGQEAIHVQSLEKTYSCMGEKMFWGGWFTVDEVDITSTLATTKEK